MSQDRTPIAELIARKRDGVELEPDEIGGLLRRYLSDEVDDAQMAAFLMAGVIRGFSDAEAMALTAALIGSGQLVDLADLRGPTVDKHSTGGVGDTTTLVVAPLLAAAGCQVAKLSGRGLGHTGGTIDKLESIPGLRTDLTKEGLHRQVADVGLAIAASTDELVPLDRRLYALRDITATVSSPALIASSVMSKKIASGASTILLDVKAGNGAFSATVADATALAELCVRLGVANGRRTGALVTDMSQPLGDAIGNALEVKAALEVLQGGGSARLRELSVALAAATLELLGRGSVEALEEVTALLDEGAALDRMRRLIVAQGGDPAVVDEPTAVLPKAPVERTWSPPAGTVALIDCRRLGEIAVRLGAGRQRAGDAIDPAVGLDVRVRVGDMVTGDGGTREAPAVRIHARDERSAEDAEAALAAAVLTVPGEEGLAHLSPPLIHRRVGFPAVTSEDLPPTDTVTSGGRG